MTMVAGSFAGVSTDGFQMNGNMSVTNIKGGMGATDSDILMMWDPSIAGGAGGYISFYYYDDGAEAGWCEPENGNYVEESEKYADGFAVGSAFWFRAIDGATKDITFSGAVESADYVEPAMSSGKQLSMVANAYPTQLQLNDTKMVEFSGLKGGSDTGDSDTLLMWDPTMAGGAGGYITFFYYDDGFEAGWCEPENGNYVEESDEYADGFAVGTAFWFKPINDAAKSIKFKKTF